jgi:hypothetical protein
VRWPRASAARREALATAWSLGLLRLLAIRVEVEGVGVLENLMVARA